MNTKKMILAFAAGIAFALLLVGMFFLGRTVGTGKTEDETIVAEKESSTVEEATNGSTKPSKEQESTEIKDSTETADSTEKTESTESTEKTESSSAAPQESEPTTYPTIQSVDTGNLTAKGNGYEGREGTGDFNYGEALQKAIIFYEEQRSGDLPETGRVSWRGDSGLGDGSDNGVDLTGGLYDAGDNVKFNLPMAYTASMLAWALYEKEDAFAESGQTEYLLDNIRWIDDYLMKCHTSDEVFYYQVGDGNIDHGWWGPAEVMQMNRPSFCVTADKPGSCVVGGASAALAASAVVFKDVDKAYADKCLEHAKSLYAFAEKTKSDSGYTAANGFYNSWSGFEDELSWAGIWLYLATDEKSYLEKAEKYWKGKEHDYKWTMCWDDVADGAALMLARMTGDKAYSSFMEKNLDFWTVGYEGNKVNYTSNGLAYLDSWGALRYATTSSFLAYLYSEWDGCSSAKADTYRKFAESQVNYALGSTGFSYMVGFGDSYPQHIHHRTAQGSYCDNMNEPSTARHVLYGALVGGPTNSGSYPDSVSDFATSEVACDYNAGFVGILACMYEKYGGKTLVDFGAVEKPTEPEVSVEATVNVRGNDFIEIRAYVYNKSAYPARVLDNLKMKYFVDLSEVYAAGGSADDIVLNTNYNEGAQLDGLECIDETNHIYALVIDFSGTKIYPGGQSSYKKEVQFRLRNQQGVWDNDNDPSYAEMTGSNGSTLVLANHITLYDGDKLIFGEEP